MVAYTEVLFGCKLFCRVVNLILYSSLRISTCYGPNAQSELDIRNVVVNRHKG